MNSPIINQIEQSISLLSYEEQLWLVERIIHNLRYLKNNNNVQVKPQNFEQQLSLMAKDPAIEIELQQIEREFAMTEMDGLT